MCIHNMKQVNDVAACTKCGLTAPKGGKPFFDKGFIQQVNKKGRKKP